MIKKIIFLLICIFLFNVSILADNSVITPKRMLLNFYGQYLSNFIDNNEYKNNLLNKYCSKKMLKNLDVLYAFDEKEGIIVGIDYDVFTKAQDIRSIKTLKIKKYKKNIYKVYWTDDKDSMIKINVVKENNDWKIDSLDSYDFNQIKQNVNEYWRQNKKKK